MANMVFGDLEYRDGVIEEHTCAIDYHAGISANEPSGLRTGVSRGECVPHPIVEVRQSK